MPCESLIQARRKRSVMLPCACPMTSCDVCVPQVKRILHYQLPPRRFWFWWCDGFQVYDALVVALWLAINVIYVQQRVERMFRLTKCEFRTPILASVYPLPMSSGCAHLWYQDLRGTHGFSPSDTLRLWLQTLTSTPTTRTSTRPLHSSTWTSALSHPYF